jgi:sucrose-6-phosphate hydrolase SacC (GH32 family)
VKFDDGGRTAWQCLATENADGTFTKLGPVLPLPEGYTGHVRDPKVWQHEGRWYMVLGAQDVQKRGKVLLFSSADLHEWRVRAKSPVTASTAWTTRAICGSARTCFRSATSIS